MDLKAARCPSCGGDLNIPEGVDYVECPFCGIDVKVRDIVAHELDSKSMLELASHALNTGNYKSAQEYYSFILDKEPSNPYAVLGKIKSIIKKDWEEGPRKTSGVKEFISENLAKIIDDKREKYLDNVSDYICGIYDDEIKKYKTDIDFIGKTNEFLRQLLYLLETSHELNSGHEKTLVTLIEYFFLIRRLNITAVGNVYNEAKLENLFKKYSEALGKIDLVKAAGYGKKWDLQIEADETKKRNTRLGCVMFLITAAVIAFIIWFLIKAL